MPSGLKGEKDDKFDEAGKDRRHFEHNSPGVLTKYDNLSAPDSVFARPSETNDGFGEQKVVFIQLQV